jgi:hypothetical protein
MTNNRSPLDWGPVSMVRRNHGLEHATINLLSKKYPGKALAGHSDHKGFWIIGEVSTDELTEIVKEALDRMNAGESNLAIHAHCGTNAVTTGVLAGTLAWLATLYTGNNWKKKFDRWPLVVLLVTGAVIVSQPLGPLVQAKVTTSGVPGGLRVIQVTRYERSREHAATLHRVLTADSGETEA